MVIGGVAFSIAPLAARMDAIESARVVERDQLLAEIEGLRRDVARLGTKLGILRADAVARRSVVSGERSERRPEPAEERAAADTAVPKRSGDGAPARDAEAVSQWFRERLFPAEAEIAELMYQGVPVQEIARRLDHSVPFLLAKGRKIYEILTRAPERPAPVLEKLNRYLERSADAAHPRS